MGKINWDYIAALAGDAPLDGDDSQERVQDAGSDDLSSAPNIDQPLPAPLTDRRDADLALRPGETLADRHGRLVLKAMAVNDEILSLPIDPDNPRTLSIISSAAQNTMNQQIKIDETRLKVRSDNRLADILARLMEAKQRLRLTSKTTSAVIDTQAVEVSCADVAAIGPERGADDVEPMEIASVANVPARLNTTDSTPYRTNAPIGYDDMPHMRTKR